MILLLNDLMLYLYFNIKNKGTKYNGTKKQLKNILNEYLQFKDSLCKYDNIKFNIVSYTNFFSIINDIKNFNPFIIDYNDNIIVIKNIPIDLFKNNKYRLRKYIIGYLETVNYDNKTVKIFINQNNKNKVLYHIVKYSVLDLNTVLSYTLYLKTIERYMKKYNGHIPKKQNNALRRKYISIKRKQFLDSVNNYVYNNNKKDYFYIDIDSLKGVFSMNKALHSDNTIHLVKDALKNVDRTKINSKYYYELLTYNSIDDISNKDILLLLNDISYNNDLKETNKHYKKIFDILDDKEYDLKVKLNKLSDIKNSYEYKNNIFVQKRINDSFNSINNALKELNDIKETLYFRYDKFVDEMSEYDEYSLYKKDFDGVYEKMNKHNSVHRTERPIGELSVYSEDYGQIYYLGDE